MGDITLWDVECRVAKVRAEADDGDNEAAHAVEDEMLKSVLRAVAAGHPLAGQLAQAALAADDIDFVRWYS